MDNQDTGGLSAEESAYFESRGEAELPAAVVEPAKVADPAVVDPALAADPAVVERDEKGKFVPHGALHAEREEHKKTRAELAEIRAQQAVLNDRWNTILKAGQTQEAATVDSDPEPDPNVDIFAHNAWLGRQLAAEKKQRETKEQQEIQSRQVSEQETVIWNTWQADTAQFAQAQPDFEDARNFLSNMRETQLKGLGKVNPQFATEQGRIQQINSELKEIIVASKQQGISPAQFIYELASAYGYTPKQAEAAAVSGELPAALAKVQAAQNASRTVAAAPGGSSADPTTPEAIAALPEAEFAKWLAKNDFRKLMGA